MTVAQSIRAATRQLSSTSDTARLDAELLMAHALGVSRSDMLLRHMDAPAPESFAALAERRARHEPLAYILGHAEFYGRTFTVTPDVLIPRGDSETVVQAALEAAPQEGRVLDLGIGSGALLLTLLAERPGLTGVGIDFSLGAVAVAAANAAMLGVAERAQIVHRDWHTAGWAADLGKFELVIANPPYVEQDAALEPDVRDFEPASALFAGPDGLDDYRLIIPQLRQLLTDSGGAVLEIGSTQADNITQLSQEAGFCVALHHDLGGRPRALVLR